MLKDPLQKFEIGSLNENLILQTSSKTPHKSPPSFGLIITLGSALKVALSQKILKNFFVARINIPNRYPQQKI